MLLTLVFARQAAGLILGPPLASLLLSTKMPHGTIWRILVSFGAVPALTAVWSRRHLKHTPRFRLIRVPRCASFPFFWSYFPFSVPRINAATSAWNCFSTSSFTYTMCPLG